MAVAEIELKRARRLAYREAIPEGESGLAPVLCVHGVPESSYMWRNLLPEIAAAGRRAIAPDLLGYGDTPPDPPATWERQIEALDEFWRELGLERAVLVVHDFGGLIALRWALDHAPGAVAGLVLSDTGFFADGEWHGMAKGMRVEGQGEQMMDAVTEETLPDVMRMSGIELDDDGLAEYWKSFASPEAKQGILELYRSGDFDKIEPYRGKLGRLGIPALALWGENDTFAPAAGAFRFAREIESTTIVIVEGAGHFVYEDDPERCAAEVVAFLARIEE